MRPEQLTAIRKYIQSDSTLAEHAKTGNDGAIAAALNAADPKIRIAKSSIPADHLRALAMAAAMTAFKTGDAAVIARWQFAVAASSGFQDDIQLSDPILAVQLAQATADKVLSQEIKDHYTTRDGTIAEREWGTTVSVDDVSESLLVDRPDGQIKGGE